MKKSILWIALILIVSGCSQKKAVEETFLGLPTQYFLFPEYLKGKVKEMHETNYWAVEQNGTYVKGKPMTWKDLDSTGSVKNTIELFDENGNMIKESIIDENNVVRNYTAITWENGKMKTFERYFADTLNNYYKPEFNEKGMLSGGKNFRAKKDTLISSNKLYYDASGNFIGYEFYNYKNVKRSVQEFTLNSNRSVTEVRFLNANDSLVQKFTQVYNDKNFLTSQVVEVVKPASTVIWKFTPLKYDDHGNCTQFLQDEDSGKFKFITERTFVYY
jgi:hypothetical protein